MNSTLLTDEVSAALAQFFYSGDGPSHATLTRCFMACGLADVDPYDPSAGMPNKQQRVLTVCAAARRRPGGVDDKLLEQLLTALRVGRIFHAADPNVKERVSTLRSALTAKGTFLPIVAGAVRHDWKHFMGWNLLGAALWSAVLILAGVWLGDVSWIANNIEVISVGIVALSLIPLGVALWRNARAGDAA